MGSKKDILQERIEEDNRSEQTVRKSIANSLKAFGFPHATTENVFSDRIYREFAKSQLEELIENYPNSPQARVCRRLLADISKAVT